MIPDAPCYFSVYIDGQSMNILTLIRVSIPLFSFPSRCSEVAELADMKAFFQDSGTSTSNRSDLKRPD